MKQMISWKLGLVGLFCGAFLLGGILLQESDGIAAQKSKSTAQ